MSSEPSSSDIVAALVVRRIIRATPERLFAAWTDPVQLVRWWGPEGVSCPVAEVDLRPGGSYRIANRLPDGRQIWISGQFECIEPPHRLVYSWCVESILAATERVEVRFEPLAGATEVIVTHERIASETARTSHERGWVGCLDGLARFVEES